MAKKMPGKLPRKQNDWLLKGAFEENFQDFLRFIYPDADELFEFSKGLTFMDKELNVIIPHRERRKGGREADLLVKVWLKDGSEKWILLHTELEGGSRTGFAFRLFQYFYRLTDRYQMPVETIVVYTGDHHQIRPSEYHYKGIATSVLFRFRTYHIFDHREEELLAMQNPFSLIVLACQKSLLEGKLPEKELGDERMTIAKALLNCGYGHDRIKNLIVFLKNFIYIEDEEINRIFDEEVQKLSGGIINMGIIEAVKLHERQLGKLEGTEQFVSNMILQTDFDDNRIASLAAVSVDFVRKVRAELAKKTQ